MKKPDRALIGAFTVVMLVFTLFMFWYVPANANRAFLLEDIDKSIDTSHGRERKQTAEYNQVLIDLPVNIAELKILQPYADWTAAGVRELKAERKRLRAEKAALEEQREAEIPEGGGADE